MRFRPCIDIHDGRVKQIVGGSLSDKEGARENFVSDKDAGFFARLYQEKGLPGGHVILLNAPTSPLYEKTREQALSALHAYPQGLQLGGGVNATNAAEYLKQGASHVICTSYVFREGRIAWENLERICREIGPEHLVLDLSCAWREGRYFVVTDRWQKFTTQEVSPSFFSSLGQYCDEFLVHATDQEGKRAGINGTLASMLSSYQGKKITYAGGIGSLEDLREFRSLTQGRLDVTIGSALDIFGGTLPLEDVLAMQ